METSPRVIRKPFGLFALHISGHLHGEIFFLPPFCLQQVGEDNLNARFFSWRRLNGIIKLQNSFSCVEIEFMGTIYKLEGSIYKVFKHKRKKERNKKQEIHVICDLSNFLYFFLTAID